MTAPDHASDPDVQKVLGTIRSTLDGLFAGNGFKLDMMAVIPAITAGKNLAKKDGAGRYVAAKVFGDLVNDHPEMIDLAFQGLSEVAKNRIRSIIGAAPVKDAEKV
jgi:hypothetical protein